MSFKMAISKGKIRANTKLNRIMYVLSHTVIDVYYLHTHTKIYIERERDLSMTSHIPRFKYDILKSHSAKVVSLL